MSKNNFFFLNKRGMELSVNTLVVLILGVLVVGSGLVFISKLTSNAVDTLDAVSVGMQRKIDHLLSSGERVALPDNVRSGGLGRHDFAMGVENVLPEEQTFHIDIIQNTLITTDERADFNEDQAEILFADEMFTLQPNERKTDIPFKIILQPGAGRGTYVFDVDVTYGPDKEKYDTTKQVRITVN